MVWPFSNSSNANIVSEPEYEEPPQLTNYSKGQKYLLEDTKPKFINESSNEYAKRQEQASISEAWKTIQWNDFSIEKLISIPCFRDAGMTGFSSMVVVGTVMFLYHKNPARSANWSVGGFILGSIVGWEQCRMKRRRSFQIAQMAKQTVAAKEKPMLHKVVNDDRVKKEWEKNSPESVEVSKPWYKLL